MSAASIQAACDTQFQTLPGLVMARVAWPLVVFNVQEGIPYWMVQLVALTRRAIGQGVKGAIEWDGIYQAGYAVQSGHGDADLWAMLDNIAALFKKGLTLTASDGAKLIFDVPTIPPLLPSEPDWTQGVVRCPFFVFEMP